MSLPPFELKKRQLIYAGCAGLFGLILIGTLLWSFGGDMALEPSDSPPKETNITTAGQRINPQEVWVERIESENKLTQEKLGALKAADGQHSGQSRERRSVSGSSMV